MKPFRKDLICMAGAIAALGLLYGCDHLSDQDLNSSGSLLAISSVTPSAVTSDVSPGTDPNTMASVPPPDDSVTFELTNSSTAGSGNDLLVFSFDLKCANGTLDDTNRPAAVAVAAGATQSISVVVATGAYKEANMVGLLGVGSDICKISFNAQKLTGGSLHSTDGLVGFTFSDVP